MNGLQASARYGCTHHAPSGCPWCDNPRGEEYREPPMVAYPGPDLPAVVAAEVRPSLPLWAQLEKSWPHLWDTPGGAE